MAERLHRELRVERGRGLPERAKETPHAAAQVEESALSDFGAARLRVRGVETPRENAPDLRVEPRLGKLVDALQSRPQSVLQGRSLRELDDRGAPGVAALFVETDDQLGEAESRRLRGVGLLDESSPRFEDLDLAFLLVAKLLARLANRAQHLPELQRALGHVVRRGIACLQHADDRVGEIGRLRGSKAFDLR